MTTKIKGTEGVEFPDSTVQGSAAYTKAQSNANMGQIVLGYSAGTTIQQNTRLAAPAGFTFVSEIDPDLIVNTANARITPNVAGYYLANFVAAGGANGLTFVEAALFKNGTYSGISGLINITADTHYLQAINTALIYMNGTTDYVQLGIRVSKSSVGDYDMSDAGMSLTMTYVRP